MTSFFARFQSATIVLSGLASSSSRRFLSSSFSSLGGSICLKVIGYAMKSEYFFTSSCTRHLSRYSTWSSRRCKVTDVPGKSRSPSDTVYEPDMSDSHLNEASAPRFIVSTVTLSATMNAA